MGEVLGESERFGGQNPLFQEGTLSLQGLPYHFIVFNVLFGSALARSSADL